jgi:hypothetical protein
MSGKWNTEYNLEGVVAGSLEDCTPKSLELLTDYFVSEKFRESPTFMFA